MTDTETITELREQLRLATSQRLRAQAEANELRRDAERYRFLRAANVDVIGDFRVHQCIGHDWIWAEQLDNELDAAIAKVKP